MRSLFLVSALMITVTSGCSGNKDSGEVEDTSQEITDSGETGDSETGLTTGGDDTGDVTGTVDTGSTTADLGFQPVEGDWAYLSEVVTVDTCNMGEETLEAMVRENAILSVSNMVNLSLLHRQGEDDCLLDEKSFSCGARTEIDRTPEDYGLDAVMSLDFESSGVFVDPETMNFNIQMAVECTGDDCWIIEMSMNTEMPCVMEIDSELIAGL